MIIKHTPGPCQSTGERMRNTRVVLDPRRPWPFQAPRKVKAPSKAKQLRELLANVPKAPF